VQECDRKPALRTGVRVCPACTNETRCRQAEQGLHRRFVSVLHWVPKGQAVHIDYTINTVSSEEDLARIIDFAQSVLGSESPHHHYDFWLPHYQAAPDLLIYAVNNDHLFGCVLGRIEGESMTVGMLAVSPDHQRCGIGTVLMREIEERAQHRHITTLALAAREEAEPFYLNCGYTPFLFIQSNRTPLAQLQALNHTYPEVSASDHEADGWSSLMLATPTIDRALEQQYNLRFPECSSQTVFIKHLVGE